MPCTEPLHEPHIQSVNLMSDAVLDLILERQIPSSEDAE